MFEIDHRCFATFHSDPLTVPLPNNTYQIYYTPNNELTSKMFVWMYTHAWIYVMHAAVLYI